MQPSPKFQLQPWSVAKTRPPLATRCLAVVVFVCSSLLLSSTAATTLDTLFPENFGASHEQGAYVAAEESHISSLRGRDAHQVLCVCEVGVELGELRVEVGVLSRLGG